MSTAAGAIVHAIDPNTTSSATDQEKSQNDPVTQTTTPTLHKSHSESAGSNEDVIDAAKAGVAELQTEKAREVHSIPKNNLKLVFPGTSHNHTNLINLFG